MTEPARPVVSAAMTNVEAPWGLSPSSPAMPSDVYDTPKGDLAELKGRMRLKVEHRFRNLQKSRGAKRREVPESVQGSRTTRCVGG